MTSQRFRGSVERDCLRGVLLRIAEGLFVFLSCRVEERMGMRNSRSPAGRLRLQTSRAIVLLLLSGLRLGSVKVLFVHSFIGTKNIWS